MCSPDILRYKKSEKVDKRLLENIDRWLLLVVLVINLVGWANLYSASVIPADAAGEIARAGYWWRQMIWFCLGLVVALPLIVLDYRLLERISWLFLLTVVILLIIVLIKGKIAGGSQRWINLGFFNLQPSMLAQAATVFFLAAWFQNHWNPYGHRLRDLALPGAIVGLSVLLILMQPDLGTAGLVALISLTIFFAVRIDRRSIVISAFLGLAAVVPSWLWMLKPYQKRRILTFLNPENDALGSGYHVIQSKIAVGSGGLFGKGWTHGTQATLNFLPERHTDFAFSVFAEEFGFVFSTVLLIGYAVLIWRGLDIAAHARDRFGTLIAVGCVAIIFWPVAINIAMVLGLFPVVGIPLPFFSYGGSTMIVNVICIALLTNVSMRRYMF
jgi:rod shape determining protein RodA